MSNNSPTPPVDMAALLTQKASEFSPHFKPGFLPRAETIFQFRFETDASFFLDVKQESFAFVEGQHTSPTISLDISNHETCWGLLTGHIDGMQAFMEGHYKADGNIVLSQLLLYVFKSNDPTIAYEIQY